MLHCIDGRYDVIGEDKQEIETSVFNIVDELCEDVQAVPTRAIVVGDENMFCWFRLIVQYWDSVKLSLLTGTELGKTPG